MIEYLVIKTSEPRQVLDITERVAKTLQEAKGDRGICHVFVAHTTAAVTTADLDPGTDLDMLDAFEVMAPKLKYRHPHDPAHTPEHILASLIGPSVTIPVETGELLLGEWQRIVLVEFSGPRERRVIVTFQSDVSA